MSHVVINLFADFNITFTSLLQIVLSDERPGLLGNSVGAVPGSQAHVSTSYEIQDPLIPQNLQGFDLVIPTQNKHSCFNCKNQIAVFTYSHIKLLF